MVDISVVGAGVVGAAVAYRLAEAGARVTVLEATDHLGAGTSGDPPEPGGDPPAPPPADGRRARPPGRSASAGRRPLRPVRAPALAPGGRSCPTPDCVR